MLLLPYLIVSIVVVDVSAVTAVAAIDFADISITNNTKRFIIATNTNTINSKLMQSRLLSICSSLYLQHDFSCKIENVTSSQLLKNSTCGCDDQTQVDCSWGALTKQGKFGETMQLTFCDVSNSNDTLPGVVSIFVTITHRSELLST